VKLSTDRIVSLSALFVGLGSLNRTYLVARNSGVGPALIEDVRIHYRGQTLATDPYDFYLGERGVDRGTGLSVDKLIPGRLVSAGEAVLTLGWEGDNAPQMVGELLGLFEIGEVPKSWYEAMGVPASGDRAVVDVTYASVYGDRWRVTSDKIVPQPLD
jgi:hypothetical protein